MTQQIAKKKNQAAGVVVKRRGGQEAAADSPFYHPAALAPHLSSRVVELRGRHREKLAELR